MAKMTGKQFDRQLARRSRRRFGSAAAVSASISGTLDRRQGIAELAWFVADEHCPAGAVDPAAIATAKGITLSFGQYGDAFDGMLECLAARFHIYANLARLGQANSRRARFTLAHELGHYFIDEHRLALEAGYAPSHGSCAEYESPMAAEQEADHFAANLLMPQDRFAGLARRATPGLRGILSLADRFGVSITAAAIRYAAADVAPCAVVKWDWRGYAWKHLSTSAFRTYFRSTFESPEDLAQDSPTRRALLRQTPPECGFFQAGTTASAWFPRIEPGAWRDVIFIEQAISLGRWGVLTFLYLEGGRPVSGR